MASTRYFVVRIHDTIPENPEVGISNETLHRCVDLKNAENYYNWYRGEFPDVHIVLRSVTLNDNKELTNFKTLRDSKNEG